MKQIKMQCVSLRCDVMVLCNLIITPKYTPRTPTMIIVMVIVLMTELHSWNKSCYISNLNTVTPE